MARPASVATLLAVAVHTGAVAWHGAAHDAIPVRLAAWQTAFVALVGVLAPFVALVLLRAGRRESAALLLGAASVGALLFGLAAHYGAAGPDHVAGVEGEWAGAFRTTALVLVLSESAMLGCAGWLLRDAPRGRRVRGRRTARP